MTAAAVPAAATTGGRGSAVFGVLQRIGRSLMMPIAVLPVAGLLLRFGQNDMLGGDVEGGTGLASRAGLHWLQPVADVLAKGGGVLFDNLPLLFAVGIAIGFARKSDGSTGLAAVVGYLVFTAVYDTVAAHDAFLVDGKPVNMGVLGGILIGITTALLFQRFYRIKLPPYLAFFGGRRFVPIITGLTAVVLGVIFGLIWHWPGAWINSFGNWIVNNGEVGAGVYGTINRLLLPFGLHHIPNSLVWFQFGEYNGATGDLNRFFAGDPNAGTFMTGFFPIMMFALPAAALAIVHTARPERRKAIAGIMGAAALTSFLTGVTEPIEFAFLFVAPVLFVAHAVLTGLALVIVNVLGVHDGFAFSAGAIDYLLNFTKAERPLVILVVGAVYAVTYYFLFRFLIVKLDLKTPGREPDTAAIEEEEGGPSTTRKRAETRAETPAETQAETKAETTA
jgi:PTS system N-acetylglucosamine-specific IIC component